MDIDELIKRMQQINKAYDGDNEACHEEIDKALLEYIDDETVTKLFREIDKWYA